MSNADTYRQWADDAERVAGSIPRDDQRDELIKLAQAWRDLADRVVSGPMEAQADGP